MNERPELRGRVTFESNGQPDAEVLALDSADQVLGAATTDESGSFTLAGPAASPASLFARCRGPVAGVAVSTVGEAASGEVELRMDAHAPAWRLDVELAVDDAPEHEPYVRLLPLAVGDIAPETMRLVLARVGEAAKSALEARPMIRGVLTRRVQAGRWWFAVDLAEAWEARTLDSGEPVSWISDGAWDGNGKALTPVHGGYEVDVGGPTRVRVHLSPQPVET